MYIGGVLVRIFALVSLTGSFLANAQTPSPDPSGSDRYRAERLDPEQVDILPLLDVWQTPNPPSAESFSPVGGYIRFWVERAESELPPRFYSRERRNWLQRFFIGRNRSRLLSARLIVNRPHVITQTVTLAAAAHDSNRRQGESWTSELGDARFLTPFFRVDQGTTASIEISLSASASVDADITRNMLSIVERGARLAAPSAPLVTSLTSSQLTQSADFVDTSISRLFGQAVAERAQSDLHAERWRPGPGGIATIRATFPMGSHLWNEQDFRHVGTWRIYVSEPIVSIFSTVLLHGKPDADLTANDARCSSAPHPHASSPNTTRSRSGPTAQAGTAPEAQSHGEQPLRGTDLQACIAFAGISPSGVLGLAVGENLTLGQTLRGDAAIAAAVQRFQSNGDRGSAAREICNLVTERAQGLGLNAYDAAAAVWAFAWNGSLADELPARIWTSGCATADLARHLRLNDPPVSAATAPAAVPTTSGGNGDKKEDQGEGGESPQQQQPQPQPQQPQQGGTPQSE